MGPITRLHATLVAQALGRVVGEAGAWHARGAMLKGGIAPAAAAAAAAASTSAPQAALFSSSARRGPPPGTSAATFSTTASASSRALAASAPPGTSAARPPPPHPPPPPRGGRTALLAGATAAGVAGLAGFALGGYQTGHPALAQEAGGGGGGGGGGGRTDTATPPTPSLADAAPWVRDLASASGVVQILSADDLEKQAHAFLRGDHVFSALLRHDMVRDLVALYDPPARRMSYVIHLGENVCGYPRIAHGGLTAAIVDEAMGHLFYALRVHGDLPFLGPAFTAHLEVDYHRKIAAGRLLLVTAEVESVEGRKLWMRATVTDGPPGAEGTQTYASARALFVAPRPARLVREVVRWAVGWVVPGWGV